jgi:hypothetical protein
MRCKEVVKFVYCPVTTKRSVLSAEGGKLGALCSAQEILRNSSASASGTLGRAGLMRGSYRFVVLSVLAFLVSFDSLAQQENRTDSLKRNEKRFNNNVFVEGGGGSIYYSIGYERDFNLTQKNALHRMYFGTEMSYLGVDTKTPNDMNVNFMLGYLYGRKHCLDTELGLIWRINVNPFPHDISDQIDRKMAGLSYRLTFSSMYSIGIGYRYDGFKRFGFRVKPMYIFKYDFDLNYLSFSLPYFDTAIYFKF